MSGASGRCQSLKIDHTESWGTANYWLREQPQVIDELFMQTRYGSWKEQKAIEVDYQTVSLSKNLASIKLASFYPSLPPFPFSHRLFLLTHTLTGGTDFYWARDRVNKGKPLWAPIQSGKINIDFLSMFYGRLSQKAWSTSRLMCPEYNPSVCLLWHQKLSELILGVFFPLLP